MVVDNYNDDENTGRNDSYDNDDDDDDDDGGEAIQLTL